MMLPRTGMNKVRSAGIRSSRRAIAKTLKTVRANSRFSRRKFIRRTAGAGLLLSIAPESVSAQDGNAERRALFFNFSRPEGLALDAAGHPATYFFTVGGQTYPLKLVSENPGVLARARKHNTFLSAVSEENITHYLEDLVVADGITPLAYIGSVLDPQAGTWKMESIAQLLSPSAMSQAWSRVSARSSENSVPLSAKREFYGMAAAFSKQDMLDELALLDYTDFARTLIGLNPDMLCAEPAGAAHIAFEYLNDTGSFARFLRNEGPASPQGVPQQQNAQGWATLIPLTQEDGTPFKMENGLNQYFPDWSSEVDARVGASLVALLPSVKDDVTLGADITNLSPDSNAKVTPPIERELTGKVWYRHDGTTAVDHGSEAFLSSPLPAWDFRQRNGETGLQVSRPKVKQAPDGRVQITFDNVKNWFFRFLGVYFQFVDANGDVIEKAQLPKDVLPIDPSLSDLLDRDNALYAGIIPPVYSLVGFPCYPPGDFSIIVNLPSQAATVNALYAGYGRSGSEPDPDTGLLKVGFGLTIAVNYGLVAFFMAVGVAELSETVSAIALLADLVIGQLMNGIGARLNGAKLDIGVCLTFFQWFLNNIGVAKLVEIILRKVSTAQLINSVPVAGQIMRAAALAIGARVLITTALEILSSPPIYQFDLSFTHDLSFRILPDPRRRTFPPIVPNEVLYYKINYLFNNGSPHFLDHVDVPDPNVASIPVTLKAIPWGGKVNVSVGFYIRKKSTDAAENDWCASHGTTGLISNTDQTTPPPDIVLQDIQIPILPSTVYIHTSKTILDKEVGHKWMTTATPPAYTPPSSLSQPGNIGAFRGITVRQATANNKGYLGYSWQAYSSDRTSCQSGARGQLDLAANLNTNQADAQDGYTVTSCGLQAALNLSYNLLTDPTANFYVDSSSRLLRQIELDPTPDFSNPQSDKSFGMLNMDSTALLLHPAGYAVSINNAFSKLEALHLPEIAVENSIAAKRFLARTYSGEGSRPGLMKSPLAACVTAEGAILVLEDSTANNRIQAFDLGGNPVKYFTGQKNPYFLSLSATEGSTYLDLAVEFSGYIYVLSRSGSPPTFRMDIYHPAEDSNKPICTTRGMNAARLTVDFWRNVYTLNYERLTVPGDGYPGITEPSVSFWLPRSSTLVLGDSSTEGKTSRWV